MKARLLVLWRSENCCRQWEELLVCRLVRTDMLGFACYGGYHRGKKELCVRVDRGGYVGGRGKGCCCRRQRACRMVSVEDSRGVDEDEGNFSGERRATSVILVGIGRGNCSSEEWRRLFVPQSSCTVIGKEISAIDGIDEAVILSTDDRMEVYSTSKEVPYSVVRNIVLYLSQKTKMSMVHLRRASYVLFNEAASLHLVRFTAGLDAEVIGDRRAVQAVKKSFDSLEGYSDEKSSLRRFFGFALRTAKKVRVEAGVAKNGMTEPAAAVDEADENAIEFLGKELKDCNVSVVGAGQAGRAIVEELILHKVESISIVNRGNDRLQQFGVHFPLTSLRLYPMEMLYTIISTSDVIFTATTSPSALITRSELTKTLFGTKKLLLVDMSKHQNVARDVSEMDDVQVVTPERIKNRLEMNIAQRQSKRRAVELRIAEEMRDYESSWFVDLQTEPIFSQMKRKGAIVFMDEMSRSKSKLNKLSKSQMLTVERMAEDLIERLLDGPLSYVRQIEDVEERSIVLKSLLEMFKSEDKEEQKEQKSNRKEDS